MVGADQGSAILASWSRLFEVGASLAPHPVRSLENVDDLGESSRLERRTGGVGFAVAHHAIPRRAQLVLADTGRDDFRRDRIAHPPQHFRNIVSRQLGHGNSSLSTPRL